jgi:hypothetical protein
MLPPGRAGGKVITRRSGEPGQRPEAGLLGGLRLAQQGLGAVFLTRQKDPDPGDGRVVPRSYARVTSQ